MNTFMRVVGDTNIPLSRWMPLLAVPLCLVLATGASAASSEKLPKSFQIASLESRVERIELKHRFDYAQLLVTAVSDTGQRLDATRMATIEAPTALVTVSPTGMVRGVADGQGEIVCSLGGQRLAIPIAVSGQSDDYRVSYVRDVMPTMSKMGCNTGTCHGSAQGKNGFKLSLRGYDPVFDHRALTDDLAGRRFNRAAPDQSLMLLKPSGSVPHVGGALTKPGEPYYDMLRAWITQGVVLDLDSPRVKKLQITPTSPEIPLPGMQQQMVVLATYSDGSVRDVTAEAFLDSSQTDMLTVDKAGLATAVRRGEAAILARFEGAYAAATVVVMGDRSGFVWQETPENNYVDKLVYEKLQKVKVLPSGLCTDEEFVRRLYLDLTGLPPEPDVVRAFVADARESRTKRDELINRLVGSPDFVDHWTNKWADLLQVNRKFLGEEGAWTFRNWIRQAVAANMPYDRFVYSVLTAGGSTIENPPAAYYKVLREPGATMENTTQLFLAVRFSCNKCHDHPFERWTQDQYYNLSAYFAQVGRKAAPAFAGKTVGGTAVEAAAPLVEVIYDLPAGDVKHERTGQVSPPAFPFEHAGQVGSDGPRREQLAQWITSRDNPYFATSYVNRIWSYLLGVGIIEPIDDIRAGNPPSNPKLLAAMTQDFIESGFDVQRLVRTVCKSRVYQHSLTTSRWNEDDEINYSHAIARRLPAETLYDAVHRATGSVSHLPGLPVGFRASQTPDSDVKSDDGFLELFGRPPRESACECERSTGVMLGQALNLVNGPTIAEAIADPNNRIAKLVAREKNDWKVIEELFMSILCRQPTDDELIAGLEAVGASRKEMKQRGAELARFEKEVLPKRQAAWEQANAPVEWVVWTPEAAQWTSETTLSPAEDGSILVDGAAAKDVYRLTGRSPLAKITGIRIEALADERLPKKGPGRAPNGNFVLGELSLSLATGDGASRVQLKDAVADHEQAKYGAALAIDGKPETGWAVDPKQGESHRLLASTAEAVAADGSSLVFELTHPFGQNHSIGKFRISVTDSTRPITLESDLPAEIVDILRIPADRRTAEQSAALAVHYRGIDAEYARLAALAADAGKLDAGRLQGAQDVAWALINSPSFLFNR